MPLISPHLSLAEFLATSHREFLEEQAKAPPIVLANALRHAVDLWEPARDLVGPMHVTSGYRCFDLNEIVGGSSTSAHCDGRATDNVPLALNIVDAFARIAQSALPFDQIIFEYGSWIHLGSAEKGKEPRRQRLMKFQGSGYEPFSQSDPRVRGR